MNFNTARRKLLRAKIKVGDVPEKYATVFTKLLDDIDELERALVGKAGRVIPARNSDPLTSHKGVEDVRWRAHSQKLALLRVYATQKDCTDEEAGVLTGLSGAWKRCSDLRDIGAIEPTGALRLASSGSEVMVCQITSVGRMLLEKFERPDAFPA